LTSEGMCWAGLEDQEKWFFFTFYIIVLEGLTGHLLNKEKNFKEIIN
jgi:hypothetical protein